MNELIKISTSENGEQVVSARELYQALELNPAHWARWSKQNIENDLNFTENKDYQGFTIMVNGNKTQDFAITIRMAKHLAMMCRTEKGVRVRDYFIAMEQKALEANKPQLPDFTNPVEAARAWADAEEGRLKAEAEKAQKDRLLEEAKPKAVFADAVSSTNNSVLIREYAKLLSKNGFVIGQNRLFAWFSSQGYLNRKNEPYQQYINQGLFEVIERVITSADTSFTSATTKITGKGKVYFAQKLIPGSDNDSLPLFYN